METIEIALVGMGKIARDQHVPALRASKDFDLVGAASPNHRLEGVSNFRTIDALLDGLPELDAVALCTPPQLRYELARTALERGVHVFLAARRDSERSAGPGRTGRPAQPRALRELAARPPPSSRRAAGLPVIARAR